MSILSNQIREKRLVMREVYGGLMSLSDLVKELGMSKDDARAWGKENNVGVQIGKRLKYDTDEVAKIIVTKRGMHA